MKRIDIAKLAEQLRAAAEDVENLEPNTAVVRIHGVLVMLTGYEWLQGLPFLPFLTDEEVA